MKGKKLPKQKKIVTAVSLLGLLLLGLVVFGLSDGRAERKAQARIEKLTQAATARKTLQLALGLDPDNFTDYGNGPRVLPEYVTALYIDSDCILHVQLYEPTAEQEQAVREALKQYSNVVVYEEAPESLEEQTLRAEAIASALEDEGFGVDSVTFSTTSGRYTAYLKAPEELAAAAAWVKEQNGYPFDGSGANVRLHTNALGIGRAGMYVIVPEDYEKLDTALQAREKLEKWIEVQGGRYKIPWYMTHYLGNDAALHIALKENATDSQRADLMAVLQEYSSAVTLERGDYPEEEREAWMRDLGEQLWAMGFSFPCWGLGEKGDAASVFIGESQDIALILSLFGEDSPYPFRTPVFPILFGW